MIRRSFTIIAIALCFCATFAFAQSTPTPAPGISFGITGEAVGVNLNKQWNMATDAVGDLSIVNSPKLGAFYIESHTITTTSPFLSAFLGGLKWTPKIDGLIAKTTLPPQMFQVSFHAAPGIMRNPAGRNALGGIAGASLDFDPSGSNHFAVNVFRADYLNASGTGGSPSGWLVSSGVAVYFGGSK